MQGIIQNGTRAVVIYSQQPNKHDARLYVNCQPDLQGPQHLGDATLTARSFTTLKGASKWAQTTLSVR